MIAISVQDDIEDGCLPTVQEEVNIINQRDLQLECVIGRGSYAKVFAVRHKQSQCLYALKVIKKSQLRREEVFNTLLSKFSTISRKINFFTEIYVA